MAAVDPLLVIVGETGSGKSSVAMELAQKLNGEIISADSWAVYKGLDIGTAKPTEQEQALVKHHCIDMVEPDGDYTAAVFKDDALKAIKDITNRGKLPIMAGGTGLYIDSVIYDFSFMKQGDREVRETLNSIDLDTLVKMAEERGYDLSSVDIKNKRRLIRVIETEGAIPNKKSLRQNTTIVGIKRTRADLRTNIENRVETMFRAGLRREINDITEKYGWECEGMQGIGYREFLEWHQGKISMGKVKSKIVYSTLQLAKRQRTWFKRSSDIVWFESQDELINYVTKNFVDNKST